MDAEDAFVPGTRPGGDRSRAWIHLDVVQPWSSYILEGFADFSTVWRLLWALALPYCVITTLGFATPDITRTTEELKKKPVVREHIHRLFIVSVTRGSNPETTRRAHLHLRSSRSTTRRCGRSC